MHRHIKKVAKKTKNKIGIVRILLIPLFILLLLIYQTVTVKADTFHNSNGDTAQCRLDQTTSVSYRSLPTIQTGPRGFQYDQGLVKGVSGQYPETHRFVPDLGILQSPRFERFAGVADAVSVPPNTQIDIGYYNYNRSGHPIEVYDGFLFTSQSDQSKGDMTRLGAGGTQGSVSWGANGKIYSRSGKLIQLPINTLYQPDGTSQSSLGKTIYSFKTIQPITIEDNSISKSINPKGELLITYILVLKNNSQYHLEGIKVKGTLPGIPVEKIYSLTPNSVKTIEFTYNLGTNYPNVIAIAPFTIEDPNFHTETMAGSEEHVLITSRNDVPAPAGWKANQRDFLSTPRTDRMKVTLIPYSLTSSSFELKLLANLTVEKTVSDTDEKAQKNNKASPGESMDYTIKVTNTGLGPAHSLQIIDDYDQKLIDIVDTAEGIDNGDTITWLLPLLPAGTSKSFTIKARIHSNLSDGNHTIINTVTVRSPGSSTVKDETNTIVNASTKLEIDKTVSDENEVRIKHNTITLGTDVREFEYIISLRNTGNTTLTNLKLIDDYDESKILIMNPQGGLIAQGKISWILPLLEPNQTKDFSIKVQLLDTLKTNIEIPNIASVISDQTQPQEDHADTTIIKKIDPPHPARPTKLQDTGDSVIDIALPFLFSTLISGSLYFLIKKNSNYL